MDGTLVMKNDVTLRSPKSRVTSLSSFLSESHNSRSGKRGIRKFAKACSRPFVSWNEAKSMKSGVTAINTEHFQAQSESSKVEPFSLLQLTHRLKKIEMTNTSGDPNYFSKSYFDYNHHHHHHDHKKSMTQFDIENNLSHISQKTPVHSPDNKDSYLRIDSNVVNIPSKARDLEVKKEVKYEEEASPQNNYLQDDTQRVVILKNFPPFVGIKAVISQIAGGPLEKIVLIKETSARDNLNGHRNQLKNSILQLWFLRTQDANSFIKYSHTGLFLINGFHITPSWAVSRDNTPASLLDEGYYEPPSKELVDEMKTNGARRCLILKKYVSKRSKSSTATSSSKNHPSPKSQLSDFNLEDIRNDFEQFGEILEISPVISKKLCLAIHYFETRSAIEAKKAFQNFQSALRDKYKSWTIWYGNDPADRPCPQV